MKKIYALLAASFCLMSAGAVNVERNAASSLRPGIEKEAVVVKAAKQSINTRADEPAWESIGTGIYREGICASLFKNCDPQELTVEIEQDKNNPTHYRIVNPYATWVNPFNNVEYDDSGTYYLYYNVEELNGKQIWYVPESTPLGLIFPEIDDDGSQGMASLMGYGDMIGGHWSRDIELVNGEILPEGSEITTEVLAKVFGDNIFGEIKNGILTYPYSTIANRKDIAGKTIVNLFLHLSAMEDGTGFPINKKNILAIAQPGASLEPYDPFADYRFVGDCKMQDNIFDNLLLDETATDEDKTPEATVKVYEEKDTPGIFHIQNAFLAGGWNNEATAAEMDFTIDLSSPNCGFISLFDTMYVEDYYGFGNVYIMSSSEYEFYYNQEDPCETIQQFIDKFPGENIYIDPSTKRIIIPAASILYYFPKATNPNYKNKIYSGFEGPDTWIQLPADYELPSAIGTIVADDVNAPVKYYNLQGMEVANPEAGQLVIVKKGAKANKVVF